jgi:RNA polymerase sigma factor (sigma-70 family)
MEPLAARHRRETPAGSVTPAELREAERGFKLMLARKFSAAWIAENAKDLLAQANIEYAEWLEANPPARNPVGWLLTCAYRRALNLFDTQSRKPRPASLEAVFHLADESTPTPEQQALDNDRQRQLREALGHLPEKERKLLALIYFEDYSIRAAGRKLGWQKSAADRHHSAAMKRMLALVGDRSLLSPAILGPAAWAVARGEGHRPWSAPLEATASLARESMAAGAEALAVGAHRLAEVWRRLAPFSEPANAAAASGAGRAAGYCAAAGAVVCGLAATGAIGPGLSAVDAEPSKPRSTKSASQVSAPAPVTPQRSSAPLRQSGPVKPAEPPRAERRESEPRQRDPQRQFPHQATGNDTVTEFGVERGSGGGSGLAPAPSSSGESSSPAPSPRPSPAPNSPSSAASAEFGM